MYESLAKYYNKYTKDIDYAEIGKFAHSEFMKSQFFRDSEKPIVVDLACGTGSLTLELQKFGYDLIGVDISPEMLDSAMEEEFKLNKTNEILWLCQDMRELDMYGTAAAMISVTDGVNHIIKRNDLDDF